MARVHSACPGLNGPQGVVAGGVGTAVRRGPRTERGHGADGPPGGLGACPSAWGCGPHSGPRPHRGLLWTSVRQQGLTRCSGGTGRSSRSPGQSRGTGSARVDGPEAPTWRTAHSVPASPGVRTSVCPRQLSLLRAVVLSPGDVVRLHVNCRFHRRVTHGLLCAPPGQSPSLGKDRELRLVQLGPG